MTSMRRPTQGQQYDGRGLSESLRDADQALKSGVKWREREVTAYYTEPMWLGGLRVRPAAILCGNVEAINGPEVPVTAGARVSFVWDGPEKGARITKIHDMTPSTTTQYRFTFLIASKGGG